MPTRWRFYCPGCGQVRTHYTLSRDRPSVFVPPGWETGYSEHVHYPEGRRTACGGGPLTPDSWAVP